MMSTTIGTNLDRLLSLEKKVEYCLLITSICSKTTKNSQLIKYVPNIHFIKESKDGAGEMQG